MANASSVVIVVPELLPVPAVKGGAVEYVVDQLSRRLSGIGLDVTVVSRPANQTTDSSVKYLSVPWLRLETMLQSLKQKAANIGAIRNACKFGVVLLYGIRVRRLLKAVETDVVYVHNDPLLALLLGAKPRRRLVLHMHNDHLTLRSLRPFCNLLMPRLSSVLCVSKYIQGRAAQAFPEYSSKFLVVPNGTDEGRFRRYGDEEVLRTTDRPQLPDGFVFLYVGRLTPDKGVHVLIDAFARVHAANPTARLLIAGSSFFADAPKTEYEAVLARKASELRNAIVFAGFQQHDRLKFLYSASDAVVVPSTWQEPSGLVVLEAMSSQTCVLASGVGGIPELITDGVTGLLVAPGDELALAQAMIRVMEDRSLRDRLACAARKAVLAQFTFDRLASNIVTKLEGGE